MRGEYQYWWSLKDRRWYWHYVTNQLRILADGGGYPRAEDTIAEFRLHYHLIGGTIDTIYRQVPDPNVYGLRAAA